MEGIQRVYTPGAFFYDFGSFRIGNSVKFFLL
jgi:hypothetical protein